MNTFLLFLLFSFVASHQSVTIEGNAVSKDAKNKIEVTTNMKNELEALDGHLKVKRPDFYAQLNQPLSENEIQVLETKFNRKLPANIQMLYRWKNGQTDTCFKSFVNNSTFLPLEEALSTAAEMTSMIGSDFEIENWWNKDWIPIFHNGGGDYICYDQGGTFNGRQGQLIEFWHADNDRNIIAPDLAIFISKLNQYYASMQKEKFDGFFEIENIEGFPIENILK